MKKGFVILVVLAVLAQTGGLIVLYFQKGDLEEETIRLRKENSELQALRVEMQENQKLRAQARDVERARQEHAELIRLRSEVSRSREDMSKLTRQMQQLQQTVASVGGNGQQIPTMQQLQRENAQLRSEQEEQQIIATRNVNSCLNNLRQIDGAAQQWALEYRKDADSTFTTNDVAPYLRNGFPACPGGGTYVIGRVRDEVRCTIHGSPSQLLNK